MLVGVGVERGRCSRQLEQSVRGEGGPAVHSWEHRHGSAVLPPPPPPLACARDRCSSWDRAARWATPASVTPPLHTSRRRSFVSCLQGVGRTGTVATRQLKCCEGLSNGQQHWHRKHHQRSQARRARGAGWAVLRCAAAASGVQQHQGCIPGCGAPEAGAAGVPHPRPKQIQALQGGQAGHAGHAGVCTSRGAAGGAGNALRSR
jgi:hypothetical protein